MSTSTRSSQMGVFVLDGDGPARFVAISAPRDEDVEAILPGVIWRKANALVGHEDLDSEADAIASLQAAEADGRVRYPDPFPHAAPSSTASPSTPACTSTPTTAQGSRG